MEWSRQVEAEQVPALQQQVEWALQHQNRRLAARIRRLSVRRRQRLVVAVAGLGLAAVVAMVASYPAYYRAYPFQPIAFGTLFGAALVLGLVLPRIDARLEAWSRRRAGQTLARRAAELLAPVAAQVPCRLDYALVDGRLRTTIAGELRGATVLARSRGVVSTPSLVILFRRPGSLSPTAIVHTPGPAERDALVAALVAAGASHTDVTGPVDGYVDRLPPARVR